MPDDAPPTQSSGELVPPGRLPPTAVGTAMLPPPAPRRPHRDAPRRFPGVPKVILRMVLGAMDVADAIANAIRRGTGSR